MSQLLYDVDERILAIKNSLKHITQSIETTPGSKGLSSGEKVSFSDLKSPKSQEKERKQEYVSNYVVFGEAGTSESDSEEEVPVKKVTFDPGSSSGFGKSCDLNKEVKNMTGKPDELIELELLLSYEKNKSQNLENELIKKTSEISKLTSSLSDFTENLAIKEKTISDLVEQAEKLRSDNISLSNHLKNYQNLVNELEDFYKKNAEKYEKPQKNLELEEKLENLYKENYALKQDLINTETKASNLEISNKELTKHNNFLEKHIKKLKENTKPQPEKKKLTEEIKQLKFSNDQLKEEIKKMPTESTLKETERKLQGLEKMVDDFCKQKKQKPNKISYKKIISNLLVLLKASKPSEITQKVQELLKHPSSHSFDISKNLRDLIIKYSPPSSFKKFPSDKKIYNWIKRLIEEYLLKLKEKEMHKRNLEVLSKAMKLMQCTFPEDFLMKIENLDSKDN